MDSLTVALAILGGIVLAGIVAHGAWSARRAGPRQATSQRQEPSATALPPGEPRLGESEGEAEGRSGSGGSGDDASAGDTPGLAGTAADLAPRRPPRRPQPQLDALIDAYASFQLDAPMTGDVLLAHLPSKRHAGSKLVLVEGLDAGTQKWEPVEPALRYGEVQAGVQLANRTGPLNEIEYSEFVQRFQAVAEALGAAADFPDMLDVMARARELDGFASQHDAQLAVRLHARGAAWSVGYIQQHARRHGFVAGVVAGRLVYPAAEEGDPPVLTLTFDPQAALADNPDHAAVRDVTVAFDVPQTDAAVQPFAAWQAAAQALAVGMDADVIDDDGNTLTTAGFAAIGAELSQLYSTLATHDLAAGSAAARRLFS